MRIDCTPLKRGIEIAYVSSFTTGTWNVRDFFAYWINLAANEWRLVVVWPSSACVILHFVAISIRSYFNFFSCQIYKFWCRTSLRSLLSAVTLFLYRCKCNFRKLYKQTTKSKRKEVSTKSRLNLLYISMQRKMTLHSLSIEMIKKCLRWVNSIVDFCLLLQSVVHKHESNTKYLPSQVFSPSYWLLYWYAKRTADEINNKMR